MSDTVAGAVEQVAAPKMITPDLWGTQSARSDQARIRDIPASCVCSWEWGPPLYRWLRIGKAPACPWHGGGQ